MDDAQKGCEKTASPDQLYKTFPETLRVMQLNTWSQGRVVENGERMIFDRVLDYRPDIVLFCEIRDAAQFRRDFIAFMAGHGLAYDVNRETEGDYLVASRFPIVRSGTINYGCYAELAAGDRTILAVSLHLFYLYFAPYMARGYDGTNFKKLEAPVTDLAKLAEVNLQSGRSRAVEEAIAFAKPYFDHGDLVLMGGDLNETSHLDWTERTKDLFDHNGVVMPWHMSVAFEKGGYQDTYRELHPDEVAEPGFTCPVNNTAAKLENLLWAADSDARDRIDYIYYGKTAPVRLTRAAMIGPATTVYKGRRDTEPMAGDWIRCDENWPSDHAATIAEFVLR